MLVPDAAQEKKMLWRVCLGIIALAIAYNLILARSNPVPERQSSNSNVDETVERVLISQMATYLTYVRECHDEMPAAISTFYPPLLNVGKDLGNQARLQGIDVNNSAFKEKLSRRIEGTVAGALAVTNDGGWWLIAWCDKTKKTLVGRYGKDD
jgi:hypothetical protein